MKATYQWHGGEEFWLRTGSVHETQILILEPLFEEKNRTRHLIVSIMRRLDAAQIGCALPDLPGAGESLTDIGDIRLRDWRDAVAAAHADLRPVAIAAFRGGSVLANGPDVWRFSPESGTRIVRDLRRTQLFSHGNTTSFAGHALTSAFLDELAQTSDVPAAHMRTIRLDDETGHADATVPGTAPWRRAEPGDDPVLAACLARDLISWIDKCGA